MAAVIELHGVHKSFGDHTVYRDMHLEVEEGETLTVIGGSGQGKSVCMKMMIGLLSADEGDVLFRGSEVSELDYASGTRITGIEVPGFISRKGKSHLRLDSGMTFAMAGLLSDTTTYTRAEVPGLGRIPLVGALFRYTRHYRSESELIILVTPRLVRPLGPGEVPASPGSTENNNPSDLELFLLGMDHRPGSRSAKPTGDVGLER